jgi:hypothetical protein
MPKSCSSAPLSQDLGLSTSEVQTLGTQAELSTFCVGFQGNFTFDMVVVFPSLRFLMFFFPQTNSSPYPLKSCPPRQQVPRSQVRGASAMEIWLILESWGEGWPGAWARPELPHDWKRRHTRQEHPCTFHSETQHHARAQTLLSARMDMVQRQSHQYNWSLGSFLSSFRYRICADQGQYTTELVVWTWPAFPSQKTR